MRQPAGTPKPDDAASPRTDFTAAVQALSEATRSLQATTDRWAKLTPGQGDVAAPPPAATPETPPPSAASGAEPDDEAQLYYERLEQTGQLVNWDPSSDLSKLPSRVTHIRHPDGSIERVGFSTA
jgi:hypothetical protein